MDIHLVHYGEGDNFSGRCCYCPPRDHVYMDQGTSRYISGETNHHKLQSIVENYYMTGDDRMEDFALQAFNGIWNLVGGGAYGHPEQARGPGFYLMGIMYAYLHTLETRYLSSATRTFQQHAAYLPSQGFQGQDWMGPLLLEGMLDVHEVNRLTLMPSWMGCMSQAGSGGVYTLYWGWLYGQTGDSTYLQKTITAINYIKGLQGNQFKDFGEKYRYAHRAFYYLSDTTKPVVDVGIEMQGPKENIIKDLDIRVFPNPFNSAVKIMVRRYAYGVRRVSFQIYDISGKLMKDFTPYASRITPYTFTWNSSGLAPGIYFIRMTYQGKKYTKPLLLLK
jgi:hypothetical protein